MAVEASHASGRSALRFSATGLPADLTISKRTGVISGRPWGVAIAVVVVTVRDSNYTESTKIARKVNEPIAILQQGTVTSPLDKEVVLQIRATDRASEALRYKAFGLPKGVTIRGATGRISGTPRSGGLFIVKVKVSDGYTSRSMSFKWTVR